MNMDPLEIFRMRGETARYSTFLELLIWSHNTHSFDVNFNFSTFNFPYILLNFRIFRFHVVQSWYRCPESNVTLQNPYTWFTQMILELEPIIFADFFSRLESTSAEQVLKEMFIKHLILNKHLKPSRVRISCSVSTWRCFYVLQRMRMIRHEHDLGCLSVGQTRTARFVLTIQFYEWKTKLRVSHVSRGLFLLFRTKLTEGGNVWMVDGDEWINSPNGMCFKRCIRAKSLEFLAA